MARSQFLDHLQAFPFWLMDVGPNDSLGLPILTPIFGFSSINAPEITFDIMDVIEGNWYFNKKVIKRANIGNITLSRGVVWYDADFWKWTIAAITGDMTDLSALPFLGMIPGPPLESGPTYRRTLVLVQYFPHLDIGQGGTVGGIAAEVATIGILTAAAGVSGVDIAGTSLAATGVAALFKGALGPFEFAARIPARAFVLKGCIPTRYKTGSEMEGASGAVHIAELELAIEMMEEISLAA